MLVWILSVLALALVWGGGLLLRVFEIEVPLLVQIVLSVVVVLAVAGYFIWRRVAAQRRAKALEAEILKQSELQAANARPDRRAEILELQKRVQQGIAALQSTKLGKRHGKSALYALPWYAIIGPPGSGKTTALKHSGLVFPFQDPGGGGGVKGVGGTRNCDWWFTNEGILLDTAGRYATDDSDRDEWFAFLGMLRKYRPEKPINGLLVAIAVSDLMEASEDQVLNYARKLRARVDEIMTRLDMVLPVYVIFTKVDLVGGFVEFWGDLKKSDRDQALGATFALDGAAGAEPGRFFGEEFDRILQTVSGRAIRVIGREPQPDSRAKIFQFPLELRSLRPNLEQFVEELFRRNAFQENPLFRGFYFTSGTQEGKPLERLMGNMARALGIRQPPSVKVPTEPKSYFVTDVFRKVVFPDQDIAGRTATELRRQKLMRALIAGTAILFGSVLLFPGLSAFAKNRDLVKTTETISGAAAGTQWGAPGPAGPKVGTLDATYKRLQQLRGYAGEQRSACDPEAAAPAEELPLSLRWGMYRGETLYPALRDAYVGHLNHAMAEPAKKKMELDLAAIGMSAGVETSQYGRMYDRVKLYVMLTHPQHLNVDWATPQLTRLWGQLLQDESQETAKEMTLHVCYYLDLLKRGEIPPWVVNQKGLALARSVLLRAPSLERTYDLLVHEANDYVAPITRERIFYGSVAPYVTSKKGEKVMGAYTREGWEKIRKLLTTESSRLSGEQWVLGEVPNDKEVEAQIAKLRKLYFERYINAWRIFLQDLEASRPVESTSSLDQLNALSEPEWPYLRLLRTLHENTALIVEDAPTMVESLAEKLIDKAENKAEKMAAKATGSPAPGVDKKVATPKTLVEQAYSPLSKFAIAPEGVDPSSTSLAQYQGILAKLVGVMSDLRDADTPAKTATLEQEFETAFRATSALLANLDGFTRPLVSPLLLRPIMGAWSGVSHDVGSAAGGLWEVTVWEEWRTKLEPLFPFSPASPKDAKVEDFEGFFKPESGLLWAFFKENLEGQIRRTGDQFVASRRFDTKVDFNGDLLNTCLGRGAKIADAFFGDREALALEFQVNLHSVSPNVSEVTLALDGVEVTYRNTPQEWLLAKWPSKEGSPGAHVRIRGDAGLDEEVIRDGEFGLLRLLAAANELVPGTAGGDPAGAPTLVATFEFPSEKATLKLDVRSNQGLEMLSPDLIRDYKCPRVITVPTN